MTDEMKEKVRKMLAKGYKPSTISHKTGATTTDVYLVRTALKKDAELKAIELKKEKAAAKAAKIEAAAATVVAQVKEKSKIELSLKEKAKDRKARILQYIREHSLMDIYEMALLLNVSADTLSRLAWAELKIKLRGSTFTYAGEQFPVQERPKAVYSNQPISPIVEEYYREIEESKKQKKLKEE